MLNKTNENLITELVKAHPFLADDDKLLLLAVWKKQGLELTYDQKVSFLEDCSTPESITRMRRKLVEKRVINPSPQAQAARRKQAEEYRKKYSRQKPLI